MDFASQQTSVKALPRGLRGTRHPAATGRVVLFPYSGGNASTFAQWSKRFSTKTETLAADYRAVTAPKRPACVASLAAACAARLHELPALPTLLFGHSLGATVALETARLLRAPRGLMLAVSGCSSPSYLQQHRPQRRSQLGDRALQEKLCSLGAAPMIAEAAVWAMIESRLRDDLALFETYEPNLDVLCGVDVLVLAGTGDPDVSTGSLRGWEACTEGGVQTHMLPGDHFYLDAQLDRVIGILQAGLRGLQ